MNARKQWMIRIILSLAFGIMVMAVALSQVGGTRSRDVRYELRYTRFALQRIDVLLAKYHSKTKRYPRKLSELKIEESDEKDGWRRDWIYSVPDGKPLIESLGRDGKRGGIGTDSDLSNRNPRPSQTRVPFLMRVQEEDARMMVISALICGLIASVIMLGALEKATFTRRELWILLPTLIIAFGVAAVGAAFITILHVPTSGH